MEARLKLRTFPVRVAAILIALMATLVVGASLGYAVRSTSAITGPAHTLVLPLQARQIDTCVYVHGHKGC
jgi:hypothetical protein